jgi:LruC domain-containing protein
MKRISLILVAGIISLASCKKDLEKKFETGQNSASEIEVSKMSDIKVPTNFKWELTKSVSVKVNLEDNSFGALKHKVQIYLEDPATNGISLAEGAISLAQEFESTISVPSATKELFVVRTAPDNSKMIEKVTISGSNSVLLNIKPVLKKTFSLGKSASPNCNTGCTQTISTSNQNLNVNNGDVICVTGNNITIGFNANGGTIRICGSNVTVQNASLNNSSKLIVTSTGSASFSNLNMNGATTEFLNWGTVSMSSSFSPGGSIINHGTINTDGDYNLNTQSTQTNNGIINVGESMNVNGNTTLTNNGSIVTDDDFKVNGTGLFINNCKLWVKKEFHNNNTVRNYSYIRVDDETKINGGAELGMYNGAMFRTKDIIINGLIKGYVATSLVKVLDDTRINGGGSVTHLIQYCDLDGIETNNGTIGNGATQACGLYIATTACNPEGNRTAPNPNPDTDGDGVIDASDCYPSDPNKAFCNNVPTGTLAFEDQWPFTGDYDMNDVVVSYNYNVVTNAANNVVRVEATYVLRATGGSFRNGFAVQFPVDRNKVSGVSGATLEAGQTKAVLVIFNDMRQTASAWNTVPSASTTPATTFTVSFNITDGPSLATFGLGAYNPFIWNGTAGFGRGYEIHLPGKLPTDLANGSLFTTGRDGSNISTGDTYVSNNGRFPWAINIPASFDYPVEKADINTAYTKFATWVSSGGSSFSNWYTNTSGYRNIANIY